MYTVMTQSFQNMEGKFSVFPHQGQQPYRYIEDQLSKGWPHNAKRNVLTAQLTDKETSKIQLWLTYHKEVGQNVTWKGVALP